MLDESCRCCGKGTRHICDRCDDLLHNKGAVFLIEVTDTSNEVKKRLTGFTCTIIASKFREHGSTTPMTPGICFIRQSDLKAFLKDDYDKINKPSRRAKFLKGSPSWHKFNSGTAGNTRSAVELPHH